jgi:hypothetical protein
MRRIVGLVTAAALTLVPGECGQPDPGGPSAPAPSAQAPAPNADPKAKPSRKPVAIILTVEQESPSWVNIEWECGPVHPPGKPHYTDRWTWTHVVRESCEVRLTVTQSVQRAWDVFCRVAYVDGPLIGADAGRQGCQVVKVIT